MIEDQWKELSKYFLDNGNRKLSTEEKKRIKLAIEKQSAYIDTLFVIQFSRYNDI